MIGAVQRQGNWRTADGMERVTRSPRSGTPLARQVTWMSHEVTELLAARKALEAVQRAFSTASVR